MKIKKEKKIGKEKNIDFIFKKDRNIKESFQFIEKILKKYDKKMNVSL